MHPAEKPFPSLEVPDREQFLRDLLAPSGKERKVRELINAVAENDAVTCTRLLSEGIRADDKAHLGHGALSICLDRPEADDNAILKLLIPSASLNQPDKYGITPLMAAAANGASFARIKLLIEAGADVKATMNGGVGVLHTLLAGRRGTWESCDLRKIELVLECGADVDAPSNWGTPLLLAVAQYCRSPSKDLLTLCDLLIERGANPVKFDMTHLTKHSALDLAVRRNATDLVRHFVERHNVDPSAFPSGEWPPNASPVTSEMSALLEEMQASYESRKAAAPSRGSSSLSIG
jgi:hypothetical protein